MRAEYKTRVGQRAFITLIRADGRPVPFGASVTTEDKHSAIVGDSGEVFLSGLSLKGTLSVSWGKTADRQCRASYDLKNIEHGLNVAEVRCR
ncbi:FimD/PapC C-terminal domain-containing protein [Pantoea sp. SGAir0184]